MQMGLDFSIKVHIFWEDHKILRNLSTFFDWYYIQSKKGRDFGKILWPSVFFNEKNIRKIPMIFDVENWIWKSFGTFWHLSITPILKIQLRLGAQSSYVVKYFEGSNAGKTTMHN